CPCCGLSEPPWRMTPQLLWRFTKDLWFGSVKSVTSKSSKLRVRLYWACILCRTAASQLTSFPTANLKSSHSKKSRSKLSMLELPILRWGKPYDSMEKADVVHFETGEVLARVHQATGAMLGLDIKR